MGCNNSKIDNEEGLSRCKQRKHLMKQTVASRHNFAASHAMFVVCLKGVGSAFRQFAEGEVKDEVRYLMHSEVSTPRTQTLSFGPPPTLPPAPMSPGFSPSPPHSPVSPHARHSALRMQNGSRSTGAVSSPESVTQEFFPPPPPPVTMRQHRMEHTPSASITNIYRYPEESSNSYKYKMDDSIPPPPFLPIHMDDDWRQSSRTAPISHAATRSNPTPPPPVTRSSWQDLFMDPFTPSPATFNYMEERKNQDVDSRLSPAAEEQKPRLESEPKMNYDAEQKKIQQSEQRRKHDIELKRIHEERQKSQAIEERRNRELELRKRAERAVPPPPKRIVEVKESIPDDIPDLEEDDVPDLEDVDEDIDVPAPKGEDNERENNAVNKPQPAQELASEPTPEEIPESAPKPEEPEPATPKSALEQVPESEIPPKTPPQTPPKVQEPPAKAANAGKGLKTPMSGKTPGKPPKPEQSISKTNKELAVVKAEKGGRDLLDVLKEVDECFLRAADSGENVSRILETKKAHYHSSFSDSLRVVGESARMNLLKLSGKSGSTSFRTTGNMNSMSVLTDESPSIMSMRRNISNMSSARYTEECGLGNSHAATLDRLLAWEKKLYLEVKEAESLRVELDRKYHLFRNQDAKNEDHTVIDKTRYTIKGLQTRMVVAIQAVDSASQQVQKLRDEELYPQLVELLNGLGTMWKNMSQAHQAQLQAVETMRRLDNSAACEPTTSSHRQSTMFLEQALNKWSEGVSRVINSQMEYLKNMTAWLRLSLMQFGSEEMDNRSGSRSPSRSPSQDMMAAPIFRLCQRWEGLLSQLPHQVVLEGIGSFAAVVREMLRLQWEELRIKKRVENYQRELERREYALQTVSSKDPGPGYHEGFRYQAPPLRSPTTTSGSDVDDGRLDMIVSTGFPERSEVGDRRLKFEATRRKLEAELEAERKAYTDTRAFTLNSLQAGLPQLFLGALAFTNSEAEIYDQLIAMGSLPNR